MAATADPWLLAADLLDPPTDELDGDPRARWHRDIRGIYVPHDPHPPQEAFLWLDCFEAFYGGAAGGGKSDALLMAALAYVDVPGYADLLKQLHTGASLRAVGELKASPAKGQAVELAVVAEHHMAAPVPGEPRLVDHRSAETTRVVGGLEHQHPVR